MKELSWISEARKYIGLREIKGVKHNPTILKWLDDMGKYGTENKAWWRDDETPWCGLFVGHCLGETGRYVVKNWFRAREWDNAQLMTKLDKPAYGCIVTFTRQGGGHVGFVVGVDAKNNLMVLGGNQGDEVKIAAFSRSRVTGYYWPSIWSGKAVKSSPLPGRYALPVLTSSGKLSTNEA